MGSRGGKVSLTGQVPLPQWLGGADSGTQVTPLISVLRRAEAAVRGAGHSMTCSHPRQVWRQPPETALGAPEALRSPGLVTQAPNTLSLIGYYSFFMKPSRLLPSSLGKTFAASFCNYISLVFVMAQK